jgi:hypothetical protein
MISPGYNIGLIVLSAYIATTLYGRTDTSNTTNAE